MLTVSIILPTCNRAASLSRSLTALLPELGRRDEVIVVDGASDDLTPHVLAEAQEQFEERLKVIREPAREGFVRAANKGFAAATREAVCWLNDDARPLPGALRSALKQLHAAGPPAGLLAMFHAARTDRNIAYERRLGHRIFRLLHVRGTLYANFGMGLRSTFERLGFFDERYHVNGADPDFSLKVWDAGLTVEPAHGAMIEHDEVDDARRDNDRARGQQDNERLFAKWDLPAPNPYYNRFNHDQPCTLRSRSHAHRGTLFADNVPAEIAA